MFSDSLPVVCFFFFLSSALVSDHWERSFKLSARCLAAARVVQYTVGILVHVVWATFHNFHIYISNDAVDVHQHTWSQPAKSREGCRSRRHYPKSCKRASSGDCPNTDYCLPGISQLGNCTWWLESQCPRCCTSIGDWRLSLMLHQYWWLEIVPDVAPVLVTGDCPPCCTSIGDWRLSQMLHQYWWLEIVPHVAPVLVTGDCPRCYTSIGDWRLSPMLHQYWWLEIVPDVTPVLVTGDCPPCCTSIGDWRLSQMLHQYWWLEIVPHVAPVFKKGLHYEYDPVNYHPVSLTSVLCKVVEHILVSSIMNRLEIHQILTPQQHSFRKDTRSKQSCWSSLIANFQYGEGPTH